MLDGAGALRLQQYSFDPPPKRDRWHNYRGERWLQRLGRNHCKWRYGGQRWLSGLGWPR